MVKHPDLVFKSPRIGVGGDVSNRGKACLLGRSTIQIFVFYLFIYNPLALLLPPLLPSLPPLNLSLIIPSTVTTCWFTRDLVTGYLLSGLIVMLVSSLPF